jgi:dolichyl-phosphate-mannose-protein mannosyltransferase
MGYGGGLLHSHVQTYPVGSQQQQVTCYHYKDTNNDWIITPTWEDAPLDFATDPLKYLKDNDIVRLVHATTGRNLHSHAVAAPVTKQNHEVSCYGNATVGDSNDYWITEIVDDLVRGRKGVETVHSLTTRIRFRHLNLGCYLRAANEVLPQWGFKQVEVSCTKENDKKDEHTYWNIESHWNDRRGWRWLRNTWNTLTLRVVTSTVPPGEVKLYRSPFLRDFWHLNIAMMTSNNALIPDPDKDDIIASRPSDWPFLHLGMRMNGWHDTSIKYYLVRFSLCPPCSALCGSEDGRLICSKPACLQLGHPLLWWFSALSIPVFAGALLWYLCRFQRKFNDLTPKEWNHFWYLGQMTFGGWCFHYCELHSLLPRVWECDPLG